MSQTLEKRPLCQEYCEGRECGRPATHVVGRPELGMYFACPKHARAWVPELRQRLS